jgi:hypothetical protein
LEDRKRDLTKLIEPGDILATRGGLFAKVVAINPSKPYAIIVLLVDPLTGEGERIRQYTKSGYVGTHTKSVYDLMPERTITTLWVALDLNNSPVFYTTKEEAESKKSEQLTRIRKVMLCPK